MVMTEADLFCPACGGYVHVFLDRCPACGAARESRLAEVARDPALGLEKLAEDPGLRRKVTHLLDGYALTAPRLNLPHRTGFEGKPESDLTIADATGLLAALLVFRGHGCPPKPSEPADVRLALTSEDLEVRDGKDQSVRVRVPLSGILAIVAPPRGDLPGWAGIRFEGATTVRTPSIPIGSLLVTYAADRAFRQVSIQNRPGMLSSKARPDFYGAFRRWLGLTAAEAAERRWTAIGLRRYLAEIGLGPTVAEEPAAAPAAAAPPGRSSTRAALEELEELRAAGLVAEDEYRRKRAEILDRL